MNESDRDELRGIVENAVAPTYQAAKDAANAAGEAHEEVKNLRLELNGGPGLAGFKELITTLETRCTINHDPDSTGKREAITEQERLIALQRAQRREPDSMAPSRRRHRWLDSTTARTIGIVLGTMLGTAAATYTITRTTTPAAQAAPPLTPGHRP